MKSVPVTKTMVRELEFAKVAENLHVIGNMDAL
jgi:hypothetical protein